MSHQPIGPLDIHLRHALVITALVLAVGAGAQADPGQKREGYGPGPGLHALAISPARATAAPFAPDLHVAEGVITRGRTVSEMLREGGVTPQVINQVAKALKGHFDFRRAMPGHSYRLVQDASGNPSEFEYRISSSEAFT